MTVRMMLAVVMVGLAGVLIGGSARAGISGSAHDFSGYGWNTEGEICIVCHTPHNAVTPQPVPLWNHTTTSTNPFTLYDSPTFNAKSTIGQPAGVSKACLSCHDGTVAVDAYANNSGGNLYVDGKELLGVDLSNDHPISFTYNTALATADGELADPSTENSGLGGTIRNDMLISDQLECSSCHDVHDDANGRFLVKSNAGSALCLTCHNK